MTASKRVLFLCTGNYYRSRFAEAVFNHSAEASGLPWRAGSRGLMIHLAPEGISEHTHAGLVERKIDLRHTGSERVQLSLGDLETADLIIALKDAEHRPMVREQFPHWADKVVYWDVTDLPEGTPDIALPAIEKEVLTLIARLEADLRKSGGTALPAEAAQTPRSV